nr:unnamed protein product [Digitaria exilis]
MGSDGRAVAERGRVRAIIIIGWPRLSRHEATPTILASPPSLGAHGMPADPCRHAALRKDSKAPPLPSQMVADPCSAGYVQVSPPCSEPFTGHQPFTF